jgi:hypothetical protein
MSREGAALKGFGARGWGFAEVTRHLGRLQARAVRIILALTMSLVWLPLAAQPAGAVTCPGQADRAFRSENWNPTNDSPAGFRAPVVLRRSGTLCSPYGTSSSWVGIESIVNLGIAQIGWIHESGIGYCRFWEWADGQGYDTGPILYGNCGDSDATEILFKVSEWFNPDEQNYDLSLYDCGTVDWGSCTSKSTGPRVDKISSREALVSSEVNFGGSDCTPTNEMMGSQGYRVRFGETDDTIKGQNSPGATFGVRSLSYEHPGVCSHYVGEDPTDETFRTYDDRN